MKCTQCDTDLTGKQQRFCSEKCAGRFHRKQWKIRHPEHDREQQTAYMNRVRAAAAAGKARPIGDVLKSVQWSLGRRKLTGAMRREIMELHEFKCDRCGSLERLEVHHFKPLQYGGLSVCNNLMALCRPCHLRWHKVFDDKKYWAPLVEKNGPVNHSPAGK